MTETTAPAGVRRAGNRPGWWPEYAGYLTAVWAALYGLLALGWTITGRGYPYGADHPRNESNLLRLLTDATGAPVFATVGFLTAALALAITGPRAVRPHGLPRALLLGYGWTTAALLLLVVPDMRVLAIAGYTPMLILGAPFGWPPVEYAEIFDWTTINKLWAVLGGLLLARALLAWQSRTAARPGIDGAGAGWTTPASAARWGRWAVWTAAVIPVLYAVTRFAWVFDIQIGLTAEELRELRDEGAVWAGAGLAAFAVLGAVLTVGLIRPWGERFPRWMIGIAGRRVPVMLAVVPATLVAALVTSAGIGLFSVPDFWTMIADLNLAVAPALLWPLWGAALGAAALAYYLRRRQPPGHLVPDPDGPYTRRPGDHRPVGDQPQH
ncbi:hypothetical protein BDK92_4772 [Micromonospora pisi]|uniref:Uncharacterized protein n=1 Tax=Micromonospora pisi TaxID=589240 RepID=A0A495JMW9_9ACTN|nr:hypothetical protein [Micromonospora pisi]RKR90400.1 hypothetical protein BDK92_4772 [Micromonospora pisi]